MSQQLENFLTQIRSLPSLVAEAVPRMEPGTRTALRTEEIYGIRQIILTGSGDSYFAAVAVAPALRAWTGLPVQPMVSMEASRYVDHGRPPLAGKNRGLLVIAISSSGEAARLVEAVQRLRRLGAITLAVTAHADSRLGQAAEKRIDIAIPPSTPAPGLRSYVASLLGLYLFSIRLAEVLMTITMDRANALRKQLTELSASLEGLSEKCEPLICQRVESWGKFSVADVLGSGPGYGSAAYTAAKLVEAAGVHATAQDAEEFHHLNFFCDQPESLPAIVFAPANAISARRTKELFGTLEQLGRPHFIITDSADFAPADNCLLIPATDELFAPILQTVPGALFAAFAAEQRAITHYRGHSGPWRGAKDAALIRNSPIEL